MVCYEYLAMKSPSSMLVPDHCLSKGQHSTFLMIHEREVIYLALGRNSRAMLRFQ